MASGDRIELLTADTFSSAMSTVAKEASIQTCASKIDNVDTDVANLAAVVNNINNVTSADYNLQQADYNLLADLYNNRIGVTNNTGGTAAAGTVMAKLNALINTVNNINTSVGTSLHSTIFIPSGNLLKTVVGSPIAINQTTMVGCFVAKYSGCVQTRVTISSGTSKYTNSSGSFQIYVNPKYSMDKAAAIYPSMTFPKTVSLSDFTLDWSSSCTIPTLPTTVKSYIHVKAGDAVYFVLNSTGTDYYITCSNLSVYGSTTSYF